ncbi:MAG: hypothetical protein ABIC96_03885 [Patescibacteria group bacterium]
MALTIAYEGLGVIANADLMVNDTGGLGTGDWGELGGGTIGANPDVYLYGSTSIGSQYASKTGYSYFDRVTPMNFSTTYAGQFIYIWINISAKGAFVTKASKGFTIRIGSSLDANYNEYLIAGKDDSNGWNGGWKLFVIDPTKPSTSGTGNGTLDLTAVRYIGVWIATDVSVRADSVWISQIAVAKGLRITGTSTAGWADAVAYCTDYANRAWGVLQEREGIYYAYGGIWIGSTAQGSATSFAGSGKVIQFGTSEYWNGSAWVTSYPSTANKIVVEDSASYSTTFVDGVVVGSDSGRAGSQFIGDPNSTVSMDLYGGLHADSVTTMYNTTFKNITGTLNAGNDADHKFFSCSFLGCSQFDPVGAPVIRNCIFAETASTTAALKWNSSIDIQSSSFIANTIGAGIHHDTIGDYTYTNLLFSGNTYDIVNSSAGLVAISALGTSNPDEEKTLETGGGSTTVENNKAVTATIKNQAGTALAGVEVAIFQDNAARTPVLASASTDENGEVVTSAASGLGGIIIRARQSTNIASFLTSSTGIDDPTDVITILNSANHNFQNGDRIVYSRNGGSQNIGIDDNTVWYVRGITASTLSLHPTAADAIANTNKQAINVAGAETHLLDPVRYIAGSATGTIEDVDFSTTITLITDNIATG